MNASISGYNGIILQVDLSTGKIEKKAVDPQDLADYLVVRGIPFRDAHEIVGAAVRLGIDSHRELSELSLAEFEALSDKIEKDVFQVLTPEGSVSSRDHFGGTAPRQVTAVVQRARKRLLK